MKRILIGLIFSLFLILPNQTKAQGALEYSLTVKGTKGQNMSNLTIVLIETSTFDRKVFKTNAGGKLQFTLDEGKEWMMNIGDMKSYAILKVPPRTTSTGSATATYNVARWNRINKPPVDRSKYKLVEVHQTVSARETPDKTHGFIEIVALNKAGRPWQGVDVRLTCFKLNKTFITKTDGKGIARFNVPNSNAYQIDFDGEQDFEYIDLGANSTIKSLTITYERLNFTEKVDAEGFLVQKFIEEPKPISNRVMVTLYVYGGPNNGHQEDVYLDMAYSNKKYYGKTDDEGKVVFLLPKKRSYQVSFKYEKDVRLLDLTRFRGIGFMQASATYNPDPRLMNPEDYLPNSKELRHYDFNGTLTERYADTPDDNLINIHAKWGNNKINSGSKEALLELGFSVKKPSQAELNKVSSRNLKPLNIAFVLDRSGSMGGERIDELKKAMLELIDKLRPSDKVSLIFFSGSAVNAYSKNSIIKEEMKDLIHALSAGGGTNIYEGLKMGYEEVSKTFDKDAVNRVVLLTDGYGSKSVDYVLEQSQKYFAKGISVSTIGVGTNYNVSLLTLISKYSGGFDHQVLSSDGVSDVLKKEFESLFFPLASNLRVAVKYNNRVVYKTLYGVPESKNTNNSVEFKLNKVFSSLNKMALLKFKIENPAKDIDKNKITIKINYFDELKQKEVEITKEMFLEWTDETDLEFIYDEQVKNSYSIATINQSLKAISDFCDAQNYEAARDNIKETLKSLKKLNKDKYSADLLPLIEEIKGYLVAINQTIKNNK